jgi:hypothetical protein
MLALGIWDFRGGGFDKYKCCSARGLAVSLPGTLKTQEGQAMRCEEPIFRLGSR